MSPGPAPRPSATRSRSATLTQILGWRATQVSGGPPLPADLSVRVEESNTDLMPHGAVADPDKRWQILVRVEGRGVDPEQRGVLEGWEATPHQRLERLLRETGVGAGRPSADRQRIARHLRSVRKRVEDHAANPTDYNSPS